MTLRGGKRKRKMTLRKGKRKVNKSLKDWVTFVKKVQKEENIENYKDAIHRAKVRKDKGEMWNTFGGSLPMPLGGMNDDGDLEKNNNDGVSYNGDGDGNGVSYNGDGNGNGVSDNGNGNDVSDNNKLNNGGRGRRRTMRRSRNRRRTTYRTRGRASRRH